MPELAFVLVRGASYPDPERVVETGKRLGVDLTYQPDQHEPQSYEIAGGGSFIAMLIPAPHPDVPHMAFGPTSPAPDDAAAAPAHFILTALGLEGTLRERDTRTAILAATIIENTDAVGAMLGHGVVFHKAGLFADMAALGAEHGELPAEIAVDITAARESATRMSLLTHGMQRYGREELYVTCPIEGRGALDFVFSMARWLLADLDKQLPTGDTLGRSAEERIVIHRVPNPGGDGPEVIKLDLPDIGGKRRPRA